MLLTVGACGLNGKVERSKLPAAGHPDWLAFSGAFDKLGKLLFRFQ
jgi:hypothetical protein